MLQETCTIRRREFIGTVGALCVGIALESTIDKKKLASAEPATIIAGIIVTIVTISYAVVVGYAIYEMIHDSSKPLCGENKIKNETGQSRPESFCIDIYEVSKRFWFIRSRRLIHSAEEQFTLQPYSELMFDWKLKHALPPGSYEVITRVGANQDLAKLRVKSSPGCKVG